MTPTYDIVPGSQVGPFKLGDSLWSILELLRTEKTIYPKIEISWDATQSHKSPITILLPHIELSFRSAPTQSLVKITIRDLVSPPFELKYDDHSLCAPSGNGLSSHRLTRGLIGKILGPTYDSQGSAGQLEYPGITFHVGGKKGVSGDRDEIVDSLVVKPKDGDMENDRGLTRCKILPGRGISLQFGSSPPVDIILGLTTHQDLLLDLGAPLRRFWKEDERMEKMWGGKITIQGEGQEAEGDSFLNYFQYGLDFLISSNGTMEKIIAYSNIPGSPLFQRYAKCPWILSNDLTSSSPISSFHSVFSTPTSIAIIVPPTPETAPSNLAVPTKKASKRPGSATSDRPPRVEVGKGGEGTEVKAEVQGMTLDRVGEGGLEGVKGEMRSRLVGFEGLVVEEDLASGGISSVLIYEIRR